MTNIFFENETVKENDLYFLCYMIERIARKLKQHNRYVVNHILKQEWIRLISLAGVLHCEYHIFLQKRRWEKYIQD